MVTANTNRQQSDEGSHCESRLQQKRGVWKSSFSTHYVAYNKVQSVKRLVGAFVRDKKGHEASDALQPVSRPLTKHIKGWTSQLDKPDVTRVWSQLTQPWVQLCPTIIAHCTETLHKGFYTRQSGNSLWRKCHFCEITAHVRGKTTETADEFDGCDSRWKWQNDILLAATIVEDSFLL